MKVRIVGLGKMSDEICPLTGEMATGYIARNDGEMIALKLSILGAGAVGTFVDVPGYYQERMLTLNPLTEEPVKTDTHVNVVVIKDGVIYENYLFVGGKKDAEQWAIKKFTDLCSQHVSNWDKFSSEEIEDCLDDGYVETVKGSICISWPDTDN